MVDAWDNSVCFASIAALNVVVISVRLFIIIHWLSLSRIFETSQQVSRRNFRIVFISGTVVAALPLFQIELVHSDFKWQSVKYSKLTGHFVTMK